MVAVRAKKLVMARMAVFKSGRTVMDLPCEKRKWGRATGWDTRAAAGQRRL